MNTDKEILDHYCEKEENLNLEFKASLQYDVVNQKRKHGGIPFIFKNTIQNVKV